MANKTSVKTTEKKQSAKNKSVKTGENIKNDKTTASATEKRESELMEKVKISDEKVADLQEKYLRLSAEYDNYRKRTLKEKIDLLKSAGESTIIKFLPVMDDFDRAMLSMENEKDIEAVKTGMGLIYAKLRDTLNQQGVKEIVAIKQEFDTDLHEAITKIPAPKKNLKGKVVDVIEKGYYLNDKVIRFAKVIIGE